MRSSVRCPHTLSGHKCLSSRFFVHPTRLGANLQLRCSQRRSFKSRVCVRAAEDDRRSPKQEFGLQAPAKPKTPYGEMLTYYLTMEPQLFKTAVEDQLRKLHDEKEAQAAAAARAASTDASTSVAQASSGELTLYKRMQELRSVEVRATLEDLMYVSILEKFLITGINMLPRMDGVMIDSPVNLIALTEGLHSKEALELVREHLNAIMGPTAAQFSNVMLKMSKFQMAQVYAASVMFGYFLRRVDQRFQLEKTLGTLPVTQEDAVARLERLFSIASNDATDDLDTAPMPEVVDLDSPSRHSNPSSSSGSSKDSSGTGVSTSGRTSSSSSSSGGDKSPAKRGQSALRRYVDQFDQATMVETARIMSVEGAALVERQTHALVGDIKALTKQIQEAVGTDATSIEEVMQRMAKAVEVDKVDTLTMSVATQRRAVLEAVAYGSFLRDVESHIQGEYAGLLTPLAAPMLPPGMGFGGSGGPDGDSGGGGGGGGGGRGRGRGGPGVKSGGDVLTM